MGNVLAAVSLTATHNLHSIDPRRHLRRSAKAPVFVCLSARAYLENHKFDLLQISVHVAVACVCVCVCVGHSPHSGIVSKTAKRRIKWN